LGLLAIALNDAGVALASGRSLLVESPGYAIVEDGGFLVGEPARRHSKINPRLVHNRFWDGLSTEALARPAPQATLVADLAAAHLAHLWDRRPDDTEGAIFVVPGTYSQQQLGLLLGIAEERRVPVRGLMDAALACCHQPCSSGALLHLDLHLHRAVLTVLEQGTRLHRAAVTSTEAVGLVSLYETWAKLVAKQFVRESRFDPLHGGETEQEMHDRLPNWLRNLVEQSSTLVEMRASDGRVHAIELARDAIVAAAGDAYEDIARLLTDRVSQGPGSLLLSHRLCALPGCVQRLGDLADLQIVPLAPGAAALGALRHAAHLSNGPPNTLTLSLPWRAKPELRPPAGPPPQRVNET
jgi:hypothetical protein